MTPTEKKLLIAGAVAAALYAVTRPEAGQRAASEVVEAILTAGGALPRGIRNNNPGNIEYIADPQKAWRGQVGTDGRFGVYDTPANGVRAIGRQLLRYAERGIVTVSGIIGTWAPSHENNTSAYAAAVARALGVNVAQPLDVHTRLPELAAAIIRHENGQNPYSERELRAWVYLA